MSVVVWQPTDSEVYWIAKRVKQKQKKRRKKNIKEDY